VALTGLQSSISSLIGILAETLTLRKQAAGSFVVATQTYTPGASSDTATYGLVELVETGVDGVTVQRGDLTVWLPKLALDVLAITPVIGDMLIRGSDKLRILELESQPVVGYYRVRARAVV